MRVELIPFIIPSGVADSNRVSVDGLTIVGLWTPIATDGNALRFLVSDDASGTAESLLKTSTGDANLVDLAVTMTVNAIDYISLDPNVFAGIQWLSLRSDENEASGAVTFRLAARKMK